MATAPPTSPLSDAILFAQQVDILIKERLSDEGKYVFSHFTQAHGFLLLAIAICRLHDGDKPGFKRFVDACWGESVDHFQIEAADEPQS